MHKLQIVFRYNDKSFYIKYENYSKRRLFMFAKKLVKSAAIAVVTVAVSVPLFASLLPANDVLAWDPDHTRIDFIVGDFSY